MAVAIEKIIFFLIRDRLFWLQSMMAWPYCFGSLVVQFIMATVCGRGWFHPMTFEDTTRKMEGTKL